MNIKKLFSRVWIAPWNRETPADPPPAGRQMNYPHSYPQGGAQQIRMKQGAGEKMTGSKA
jgi:hypothetical protein